MGGKERRRGLLSETEALVITDAHYRGWRGARVMKESTGAPTSGAGLIVGEPCAAAAAARGSLGGGGGMASRSDSAPTEPGLAPGCIPPLTKPWTVCGDCGAACESAGRAREGERGERGDTRGGGAEQWHDEERRDGEVELVRDV